MANGVPVLVLEEQANIEGLRASIRVHLPAHLPSIGGQSIRLDLGDREINLFDLRRVVHLLKQEYGVDVTGLYVRGVVIHRFAERELKLKLFPSDAVAVAPHAQVLARPTPSVQSAAAQPISAQSHRHAEPARPPEPVRARHVKPEEIDEPATEELDLLEEEPPPPAVLVPAPSRAPAHRREQGRAHPSSSLSSVTLPHDIHPDDLPPARPIAPPPTGGFFGAGSSGPMAAATRTYTLNRTLRSGTVVRFDGDVVVFGDVNPGAQIVAAGNIAVLGALKGMAHAGCDGDESSFIMAFDLRATQIRIGSKIAVPTGRAEGTEVACVSGDDIVVEPYKPGRKYGEPDATPSQQTAPSAQSRRSARAPRRKS